MNFKTAFSQDFFRQLDEIWSCPVYLEDTQAKLTAGVLAQLRQFEDTQAKLTAGILAQLQQFEDTQAKLTAGVLAQVRQLEDTQGNAVAAMRRLQENQDALVVVHAAVDQVNISLMVDAMESIRPPDWIPEIALVKACLEEARLQQSVSLPTSLQGAFGRDRFLLSAPLLPIRVRCNVKCLWCSEALIASGRDQVVDGASREVPFDLDVAPVCPTCLERGEADPDYWGRCLSESIEPAPPQLRLIQGLAESTSGPRGRAVLHLVQRNRESKDE
jgi:hypothetical protein